MANPDDTAHMDAALLPFMRADDAASEAHLSDLMSRHSESTIKGIIRSQLRVSLSATDGSHDNQEALELLAEIQTDLVAGLRRLRGGGSARTIGNLQSYVGAVAFNACHQRLRRKYPERLRLKNKLRYLLTHSPQFALWETDRREWLCGFAAWRGGHATERPAHRHLTADRLAAQPPAGGQTSREAFVELVTSIFRDLQAPVLLEDLVRLVAEVMAIKDESPRTLQTDEVTRRSAASLEPPVLIELERRGELRTLWAAICDMPVRHRAALLLNLRDARGADALELLPLARIATIPEIARVLDFPPDHFARIWNELPWDDLTIARHLGLTRQQVINLRQSARARLARQWRGF